MPLCEDGAERMVNQSNIEEYITLMCDKMFSLGMLQIKWIREGMDFIISPIIVGIV